MEASGCLVALAVFKTDVARHPGQAGSIPVRLRQLDDVLRTYAPFGRYPVSALLLRWRSVDAWLWNMTLRTHALAFPPRKRSLLRVSYPRNAPMIYVFVPKERPR